MTQKTFAETPHFIMVRVMTDQEPVPIILGANTMLVSHRSPKHCWQFRDTGMFFSRRKLENQEVNPHGLREHAKTLELRGSNATCCPTEMPGWNWTAVSNGLSKELKTEVPFHYDLPLHSLIKVGEIICCENEEFLFPCKSLLPWCRRTSMANSPTVTGTELSVSKWFGICVISGFVRKQCNRGQY